MFGIALRAFPKRFRERHGDGLRAAFSARHPKSSRAAAPVRWISLGLTLSDTVVAGLVQRMGDAREAWRGAKRGGEMRSWLQEIRTILRGLRRSPVFTSQAVLTVALGAVGVGAIYPVLYQVVLRPLPYQEPDRLMTVRTTLDQQLLGVTVPEVFLLL